VSKELIDYDINKILQYGTLPPVYLSDDPWDELREYAGLYLKEEIMAEAAVRKIENFSRFLEFAAMTNGQILNYESIARDAQVPARTIREYYVLLQETLMGTMLNPVRSTQKRKCISAGKFYFFDLGVLNALLIRKNVSPKTKDFGLLFEHFIYLELKAYLSYFAQDSRIEFWRIDDSNEVDFIIDDELAIEVKATELVQDKHLKGLKSFAKVSKTTRQIIVSFDKVKRQIGDIEILPYKQFLADLWDGKIVSS
jgi:predicted AAA+ superfamily ATPase